MSIKINNEIKMLQNDSTYKTSAADSKHKKKTSGRFRMKIQKSITAKKNKKRSFTMTAKTLRMYQRRKVITKRINYNTGRKNKTKNNH